MRIWIFKMSHPVRACRDEGGRSARHRQAVPAGGRGPPGLRRSCASPLGTAPSRPSRARERCTKPRRPRHPADYPQDPGEACTPATQAANTGNGNDALPGALLANTATRKSGQEAGAAGAGRRRRAPSPASPSSSDWSELPPITVNQLIDCRNHNLEFKETMLRIKNRSESNHQNLVQVLNEMKYKITETADASGNLLEGKVSVLRENETLPNGFEGLKLFLPHLRTAGNMYPVVATGKGKSGVTFALGITTIDRRNHTYLKQTLTSVLSRMTPEEEEDSVVIVSVADTDGYLNSVVDMVKTKFKRQVQSGSLEVISIPTLFYPSTLDKARVDSESWQIKQALDYCILMLYAQPKATYYLQLEDDIIARQMYFTKMKDFVNSLTSKNWLYIEFSVLGFIGKLFQSKDLLDFVHFFLMFYKVKPIDILLNDIFLVRMCNLGEHLGSCIRRQKGVRIQYRPSLFQHVGTHSSFPGRKQYLKDIFY
ncbi:alpha-1,3-mannosyl-glycoprotein 4-beta-N-acetylglucosaminyltransferase-like protein MGAT4D [Onychomys torridus]|uniref:alpha-1,3-mannosyl-glycoprotein 4-beta-N-acetylglucosaminyltransferase-like protein MGAT4D n=1 Tax=Onychomys torridus TaxID=38674 RepID=UPI00167F768D|nr:alpha-1,3-mannosyl-glycoprotein 4-beta-N-acetylglucosaminyltransferase-like protein MGAT4D [Onychomys torridus]